MMWIITCCCRNVLYGLLLYFNERMVRLIRRQNPTEILVFAPHTIIQMAYSFSFAVSF